MTRFVGTPLRGIEFANPSDEAVSARTTGDAHPRIRIDAGGRITWSSGSSAGDALLYRDAAGYLTTDTIFEASGGLITLTTNGVPAGSLPNGAIAIDTTNNVFYFRSNDEWLEVSSGANVTIQATEPLDAESGDLWFDSDTEVLYILNGAEWVSVSGSLTLAELDDVSIAGVQAGEILAYDGTNWVPSLGNNPKYAIAEVIGDGIETEFTITHNFQSRDVFVIARNNISPYEQIEIAWESTDVNNVDIIFSEPPSVDGVRINVLYTGATTLNATYVNTVGDGTSLTYVVTHDLGTRDVNVVCREAASPYGVVDVAWEATSTDTVTLYFAEAPESSEIRVVVYSSEILFSRAGARQLNELSDVNIDSPLSGDFFRYNGTDWTESTAAINDLSDVSITSPSSGQVLKYNGTSWVNDTDNAGTSIAELDDIGDVSVTAAASGDVLKFDGTNWVPLSGVATETYVNTAVSNLATETYVDTAVSNLIDSAPTALNTLNELAAALGDDENFATTVTTSLSGKAPLDSPALTGTPTAPTATYGTDTTQVATTEFVQDAIGGFASDLDGLSDVVITSAEEFQSLTYNGSEWVNSHAPTVTYVRNAEATTLTTGTVVYLFGATGDYASVKRADNDSDTTSSKTIGLVAAPIAASQNGPVVTRGYVDGINLSSGYTAGDILWLGEDGTFTTTKPSAPEHLVFIGVVVRATNNGIVYVATQNGYELDELHDVSIVDKTSGDFLKYNGSLWVNSQIAINDLSDVNTSGLGLGSLLIYKSPGEEAPAYWQPINADTFIGGYSINQLEDVEATTFTEGSILVYDSSEGVNAWVATLYDSALQTNQVLFWDATESRWENRTITLGSDTVGNYVSDVTAGTGVTVTHTPSEGSSPTIAIGQAVGTTDNPTFAGATLGSLDVGIAADNGVKSNTHKMLLSVNNDPLLYSTMDAGGITIAPGQRSFTNGAFVAGLGITVQGGHVFNGDGSGGYTTSGSTYGSGISITAGGAYGGAQTYGGQIYIQAGDADAGSSSNTGGDVVIRGGGTNGKVSLGYPSKLTEVLGDLNVDEDLSVSGNLIFEGATANNYETTITVADPTADRTITIPNASGTVALSGSIALGTDTTGNYMSDVLAGTGISVDHTQGEGSAATISIGQSVDPMAMVQFYSVQTTGDITIGGNLTVNGTTTTINTATLSISDNIITLNGGAIFPTGNAGIEVNRGGGMYSTPSIRWNEMDDKWEFSNDGMTYTAIGGSVMSSSSSAALITMDIGV